MNIQDKLAVVDAKIKKLQLEQRKLRTEAVDGGFAYYAQTTRRTAPTLAWWKEAHPRTWSRYAKESTVNHFTWNK